MADVNPIQVQKSLSGIDYPATKDELISRAREKGASDEVQQTLNRLPDQEFNSPNDVSEAIGNLDPDD